MRGDAFAVFDSHGDLHPGGPNDHGLFYKEARHLSKGILRLAEMPLTLLSSTVRDDGALLAVDLTNSEIDPPCGVKLLRGVLHIHRTKFLWRGACQELIEIHNYGLVSACSELVLEFAADFVDIFEVRGYKRSRRGRILEPQLDRSGVTLAYEGLDGLLRTTKMECSAAVARVAAGEMRIPFTLAAGERTAFTITASCVSGDDIKPQPYKVAAEKLSRETTSYAECDIRTSNEQFNEWVNRSKADLRMLTALTPEGPYPYAGVPWFSTVFGRDGIVTALECLWICPEISRGVLKFLAATQATEVESRSDSEPGKILHEAREGEMARISEVPFRRRSVDNLLRFSSIAGIDPEHNDPKSLCRSEFGGSRSCAKFTRCKCERPAAHRKP